MVLLWPCFLESRLEEAGGARQRHALRGMMVIVLGAQLEGREPQPYEVGKNEVKSVWFLCCGRRWEGSPK